MRHRPLAILFASVVATVACKGPPAPLFASGDRLRAHVVDGGEGAVLFEGWFDSELGADCEFRVATDGALRCLPLAGEARYGLTASDVVFRDAACTQPVRVFRSEAPPPASFTGEPGASTSCETDDRPVPVFTRGDEVVDAQSLYYLWDGECVLSSSPIDTLRVFEFGPEVDAATFVAATVVDEPVTSHLAAAVRRAEDGSFETVGAVDRVRDAACWPLWGELPLPCIPTSMAWGDWYRGDATCEGDALAYTSAMAPGGSMDCPIGVIVDYDDDACSINNVNFYEVGAPAVAVAVSDDSTGACVAITGDDSSHRYVVVGEPIPASAFPTLSEVRVGRGRLRVPASGDNGQAILQPDRTFFDEERDEACHVTRLCDGTTRCIPPVQASERFADAACTTPIVAFQTSSCPVNLPLVHLPSPDCDGVDELREIGEAVEPAGLWTRDATGCTGYGDPDPAATYYGVGAVVDVADFAEVIVTIE